MRKWSLALTILVGMAGCSKAAPSIDGKWQIVDSSTGQPAGGKSDTIDLFTDGSVVVISETGHFEKLGKWTLKSDVPLPGFTGVAAITADGRTSTCSYQIEGKHLVFAGDTCGLAARKGTVLTRMGEAEVKFPGAAGVWTVKMDGRPEEVTLTLYGDGSLAIKVTGGETITGKWVPDPRTAQKPGYNGSITVSINGKEDTCSYRVGRWDMSLNEECPLWEGVHITRQ